MFELAGGAIGDFENSCVPKEQREAAFTVAALHQWDLGIDDPRCVGAAEDVGYLRLSYAVSIIDVDHLQWLDGTLEAVRQGGPFPSVRVPSVTLPVGSRSSLHPQFLGRSDSAEKIQACFGKSWDRLVEVKRKYDPANLFRNTFWPLDEGGQVVETSLREPEAEYDHVPKHFPIQTQTDVCTA